jgi:uncharacterized membrane protein
VPESARPAFGTVWNFIYPAGTEPWGGINILYVLVPWIGVMMAGYGFGRLFERQPADRDGLFLRLGATLTALFILVGSVFAWGIGTGGAGGESPFYQRLLGQQKYPASQLFLLMTLGPTIALLPWAARARGWLAHALTTSGRVPMFYYLAHLLVIHVLAIATMQLRFGEFDASWFVTAPYAQIPPERRWSLTLLYVNWIIALVILYALCAWYARRKATRPSRWMAYV